MKNILALTMILALSMFCMMGCSSESASKNDEIPTVTVAQEETSETVKSAEKTVDSLQFGATYSTNDVDIVINDITISDYCEVRTGPNVYSTADASEGNTFVIVNSLIKNKKQESIMLYGNSPFKVEVVYDGGYRYSTEDYVIGEEEIVPLASKEECIAIEIPDEVVNAMESLVVYITIGSTIYQHAIR